MRGLDRAALLNLLLVVTCNNNYFFLKRGWFLSNAMQCVIYYIGVSNIDWLRDFHTCRASRLYYRCMPMALKVILNMAAKFPELKAKAQLPRCTCDPAYILSLGPTPTPRYTSSFSYMKQLQSRGSRRRRQPGGMSSPVVLLHLRRLDRFLKHQGLHSTAHTYDRLPIRPLPRAWFHLLCCQLAAIVAFPLASIELSWAVDWNWGIDS